jgi:hypothetical protein
MELTFDCSNSNQNEVYKWEALILGTDVWSITMELPGARALYILKIE